MTHDVLKSIPQGSNGAQDEENRRIESVINELAGLCELYVSQLRAGQEDGNYRDVEPRVVEAWAKEHGCWLPFADVFSLGVVGPSGHENDTYIGDKIVYKVNNLMNSGGVVPLLRRVLMHNRLFPDTAYRLYGFTGFDGRTVLPILTQARVTDCQPATQIMIDTYMAAMGFRRIDIGRYRNDPYEVWDLLPRNVLVDADGDIYVVDAEISERP